MPDDAIRPLSIGEIADRSVTLAVRRWRTLVVLVLIEAIPVGVLRATYPSSGLLFVLDVVLIALVYQAGIFTAAARGPETARAMLKAAAPYYGAALRTYIASLVWMLLWLIVCAIAGGLAALPFAATQNRVAAIVAASIAGGAVGLAVLPRAGLVAATMLPIAVLERRSAGEALARARLRVNQAGFLRSSLLGLAVFAVTVAPTVALGPAFDALTELTKIRALDALEVLASDAASLGLGVVFSTVAALEMRAHYEGSDLEAELDAAAVTSPDR